MPNKKKNRNRTEAPLVQNNSEILTPVPSASLPWQEVKAEQLKSIDDILEVTRRLVNDNLANRLKHDDYFYSVGLLYDIEQQLLRWREDNQVIIDCSDYKKYVDYFITILQLHTHYPMLIDINELLRKVIVFQLDLFDKLIHSSRQREKNKGWLSLTYRNILAYFDGFYVQFSTEFTGQLTIKGLVDSWYKRSLILAESSQCNKAKTAYNEKKIPFDYFLSRHVESNSLNQDVERFLSSFFTYLKKNHREFSGNNSVYEIIKQQYQSGHRTLEFKALNIFMRYIDVSMIKPELKLPVLIDSLSEFIKGIRLLNSDEIKLEHIPIVVINGKEILNFCFDANPDLFSGITAILSSLEYAQPLSEVMSQKSAKLMSLNSPDNKELNAKKYTFYQFACRTFAAIKPTNNIYLTEFSRYISNLFHSNVSIKKFPIGKRGITSFKYLTCLAVLSCISPIMKGENDAQSPISVQQSHELFFLVTELLTKFFPEKTESPVLYNDMYSAVIAAIKLICSAQENLAKLYPEKFERALSQLDRILKELSSLVSIDPDDLILVEQLVTIGLFNSQGIERIKIMQNTIAASLTCYGNTNNFKRLAQGPGSFSFYIDLLAKLNTQINANDLEAQQLVLAINNDVYSRFILYLENLKQISQLMITFPETRLGDLKAIPAQLQQMDMSLFTLHDGEKANQAIKQIKHYQDELTLVSEVEKYCQDIQENLTAHSELNFQLLDNFANFLKKLSLDESHPGYKKEQERYTFYSQLYNQENTAPMIMKMMHTCIQLMKQLPTIKEYTSKTRISLLTLFQIQLEEIAENIEKETPELEPFKLNLLNSWIKFYLKYYNQLLSPIFMNLHKNIKHESEKTLIISTLEKLISHLRTFPKQQALENHLKKFQGYVTRITTFERTQKLMTPRKRIVFDENTAVKQSVCTSPFFKNKPVNTSRKAPSHSSNTSNAFRSLQRRRLKIEPIPQNNTIKEATISKPVTQPLENKQQFPSLVTASPNQASVPIALPPILSHGKTYADILKSNLLPKERYPVESCEKPRYFFSEKTCTSSNLRSLRQDFSVYICCFELLLDIFVNLSERHHSISESSQDNNDYFIEILSFLITIYSYQINDVFNQLSTVLRGIINKDSHLAVSEKRSKLEDELANYLKQYLKVCQDISIIHIAVDKPQSFISHAVNWLVYYTSLSLQPNLKNKFDTLPSLQNNINFLAFNLRKFVFEKLRNKQLIAEITFFLESIHRWQVEKIPAENIPHIQVTLPPIFSRENAEYYSVLQLVDLNNLAEVCLYEIIADSETLSGELSRKDLAFQLHRGKITIDILLQEARQLGFNRKNAEMIQCFYDILIPCNHILIEIETFNPTSHISKLKANLVNCAMHAELIINLNSRITSSNTFIELHALLCRVFTLNSLFFQQISRFLIHNDFVSLSSVPDFPIDEHLWENDLALPNLFTHHSTSTSNFSLFSLPKTGVAEQTEISKDLYTLNKST